MSVTTVIGSILDASEKYIVHQTNCVMTGKGGGLAYFMFEKFPYADCYQDRSKSKEKDKPGTIDIRGTGPARKTKSGNERGGDRYVINLMGQYYPGGPRYSNDSAQKRLKFFKQGLAEIGNISKLKSIAFPYTIGCGIGGGNWKKYKSLIEEFAEEHPKVKVVIYKLPSEPDSDEDSNGDESSTGENSDEDRDNESNEEDEGSDDDFCEWEKNGDVEFDNLVVDGNWKQAIAEYNEDKRKMLEKFVTTQVKNLRMVVGIYPPQQLLFSAFNLCPFDGLKVVVIGQDPYHGPKQAMGLCFGVNPGIKVPPSLRNIYKEIEESGALTNEALGNATARTSGDLTSWAEQGVLLLNTALTVVQGKPNSHSKQWKPFTDYLIKWVSDNSEDKVIFVLWGRFAQSKKVLIDTDKHAILEATHPSPLGANKGGFFGCDHFVKINKILAEDGKEQIKW